MISLRLSSSRSSQLRVLEVFDRADFDLLIPRALSTSRVLSSLEAVHFRFDLHWRAGDALSRSLIQRGGQLTRLRLCLGPRSLKLTPEAFGSLHNLRVSRNG